VPITVSVGVAGRGSDADPDSLYRRADRALYRSKSEGRNRVTADAA
jgi:two-component system, cell cycle response regulator